MSMLWGNQCANKIKILDCVVRASIRRCHIPVGRQSSHHHYHHHRRTRSPLQRTFSTMPRTVYLNGKYIPETEAKISVFDRGFTFSDSVYEVTSVLDGKLVDFQGHMVRLQRSLRELDFAYVPDVQEYLAIHRQLIQSNNLQEGAIYLQVTRGAPSDRSFVYDDSNKMMMTPTVFLVTQPMNLTSHPLADAGLRIISLPDQRWGRCDIKTTQLLYQSLCKMQAKAAGCDDAWMYKVENKGDENAELIVTEGASNNAWIIKDNTFITRHADNQILNGTTRKTVARLLQEEQLNMVERPFTLQEAQNADEAFTTSSTLFVMPVVEIDGKPIGNGTPGPLTRRLREIYMEESRKAAV